MIRGLKLKKLSGGGFKITLGKSNTYVQTSGEVDAFFAGLKLAHLKLFDEITPILEVSDGKFWWGNME